MFTSQEAAPTEHTQMPLAQQIDDLFGRAEPRLIRIARSQLVAPDAVGDIVQETLLEAWRSLNHLRDETRFAAWLDGICRNVCRRHQRKQGTLQAREVALVGTEDEPDAFAEMADPDAFDPAEELMRQDLVFLLDRAMGYLSPENRAIIEQFYLADVPQQELAAQMGLTLSALESRLHRARGQIWRVLHHNLRSEATALGLALTTTDETAWRETRIRCIFCGRQRMLGIFEPMPDGRINLRMRCPNCENTEINSMGMVDLTNARAFLPAMKKLIDQAGRFYLSTLEHGGKCQCPVCGQQAQLNILQDDTLAPRFGVRTWLASDCACSRMFTSAISLYGALPQVRAFWLNIDRLIITPEVEMEYQGQRALRFSLLDLSSKQQLHVFANADTLLPLDVVIE